jgi:uncharacterized protein (UPF0548 family)
MFLPTRPSVRDIDAFVAASRELPLSYGKAGLARESPPGGFTLDETVVTIGSGVAAFARAKRALIDWRQCELGWIEVFPKSAAIDPGTPIAVLVRHLGFWSLNGCRVVYRVGDANEFGYAYGTLTNHAECGEEVFAVRFDPRTDAVSYAIRAVSRPRALLARLGHPFVRRLQARFRVDSARALRRAVD